jgi:predicted ATPase/class 3 adenylate cyclase/DNA-binding CsgD family transcriptional regulator
MLPALRGDIMVTVSGRVERAALPGGVVTFLLTDVVGSTHLWAADALGAAAAVARQRDIIAGAVGVHRGVRPVEQGEGDSVVAVFERASDALAAAVEAQLALAGEPWAGQAMRVRMGVHTGEAEFLDDRTYGGEAIIRCARIRDLAQGGQVLVSAATVEVAGDRLPPGSSLVPVGSVTLRGLSRTERLHQLVHEAVTVAVAQLASGSDRLGSWPTRLIGRSAERAEVGALLETARQVTITGAGGAGKTRLAHAVATDLIGRFTDVVWVELGRVTSAEDVVAVVARGCGAAEAPGVELAGVLVDFLGEKDVLVVLDNCEHLVGACASLAERVIRATPHVRLLATSREPLGVHGEITWRIPSLEVPPDEPVEGAAVARFDAAQLFVDRAQAAVPAFALDDVTAGDVAAICRRLDGLPLAIELAAARLRSMTIRAVADGLDDRFRLLTGGSRTALPRQQTLVASVEWSYGLCDEEEQQLLRSLAVFVAPFSVEAAEAVAAEVGADRLGVFDLVSRLVDKSLVQAASERYRLLETIRQFARERAAEHGELATLRDAHLRWFAKRAALWQVDREVLTETTMREIRAEAPDLVAALEWSLRPGQSLAISLLWPLGSYWVAESSFAEVSRIARLVWERLEPGSAEWFDALLPMAEGLTMARDREWIKEARAILAAEPATVLGAENRLAAALMAGEMLAAHAMRTVPDTIAGRLSLGSPGRMVHLEWAVAGAPGIFTDPGSLSRLESVVEAGRRLGNRAMEYGAAAMLAYGSAAAGAVKEADRWCEWLDRHLPADAWGRASLGVARGYLALFRCDFDAAWRAVSDRARRRPPDLPSAALAGLVGVYTLDPELLRVGLDVFDATQSSAAYVPWSLVLRSIETILAGRLADARAILEPSGGEGFQRNQSPLNERLRVQLALATGDVDTASEKSAQLRSLLDAGGAQIGRIYDATYPYPAASLHLALADVAAGTGNLREAEESAHRALSITGADLSLVTVDALELLAVVLAQRNRVVDAARLLGATENFRELVGYRFRFPFRDVQVEALRPELGASELTTGSRLTLDQAVILAQGSRGKRGRPNFGWDSLTPTELRVVELVGNGCSNAEIAAKLLVGVSTIKTHLVHVYEKLGLRSRTELAAVAAKKEPTC